LNTEIVVANVIKNIFLHKIKKNKKMATNRTFTMIKPDAVASGYIRLILTK
jgi:hypothetical protein